MLVMERSKPMTKQVVEILMAAIAIATGLPRGWPYQPHRPYRSDENRFRDR
jgi:hypothetical protein